MFVCELTVRKMPTDVESNNLSSISTVESNNAPKRNGNMNNNNSARSSQSSPVDAAAALEAQQQQQRYGWYRFQPQWLQRFCTAKWALFWLCWGGALQGE